MTAQTSSEKLPDRLIVVAGTYDGVIAGWDNILPPKKKKDTGDNDNDDDNDKKNKKTSLKTNESLMDMLNSPSLNKEVDKDAYLKMCFAMAVHDGSVRSLSISSMQEQEQQQEKSKKKKKQHSKKKKGGEEEEESESAQGEEEEEEEEKLKQLPGSLLSTGYDESLAVFSLDKYVQSGELKTPSNLGTPTCSSFAPPTTNNPTHTLIGLSCGKIIIYRSSRKNWNVEHILSGHDDKGVTCIAVHPSGKMALSGGRDGKICLWDLMRGRVAFVYKIPSSVQPAGRRKCTVNHIVWSDDGQRYAYCTHEGNITAREMETGEDLLDITLPLTGRANQICFIGGEDGLFLAAACNDGSLPVFAVGSVDENEDEEGTRRALMAIEPVEGVASAQNERFKCIRNVMGGSGFLVVTANSGGVISIIDLEGAVQMMLSDPENESGGGGGGTNEDESSSDDDEEEEEEVELAADILESVRVGTGARITSLAVWSSASPKTDDPLSDFDEEIDIKEQAQEDSESEPEPEPESEPVSRKRKAITSVPMGRGGEIEMDDDALEKARALVSKAKKRQKRKKGRKSK